MYKYKDILFALMSEYQKNEELLRDLEKHIRLRVNGKISFSLEKDDEDNMCELYYTVSRKHQFLRNVICNLTGVIETGMVYSSNNDHFSGDTKDFEVTDEDAFRDTLDKLLARPFNQKSFNTMLDASDEVMRRGVTILADEMSAYSKYASGEISSLYLPKNNIVRFRGDGDSLVNYRNLYDFMDMEFPKEQLPVYLQELIESSDVLGKPVAFYDDGKYSYHKDYRPIQEEKRLVLLNKKLKM